jgi:CheY-like chemotaxis protein
MPGMDGMELARAIKGDSAIRGVRLILLSSVLHDYDARQLGEVGFQAHLIKPVRQSQLLDCIASCMGAAQRQPSAPSMEEPPLVSSAEGALTLPRRIGMAKEDSADGEPPLATPAERAALLRRRILVVEDNAVNQEVTKEMLAIMGCRVEVAKDGGEAVAAVKARAYDLVLMDCQMPIMDGFEATEVIRNIETRGRSKIHLPIVALTADAVEGDRERCLAAGMDDYLAKPFTQDELRDMMEKWLLRGPNSASQSPPATDGVEKSAEIANTKEMPVPGPLEARAGDTSIDGGALANIAALQRAGSPPILSKVIPAYFESSRQLLETLCLALGHGDPDAARQAAHALKSSSANLGARKLASLSKQLEDSGRANSLENAGPLLERIKIEHGRVVAALQEHLVGAANGESGSS